MECDHICKTIFFETDRCEAEIAIACISYLASEDVLADLSEGPSIDQHELEERVERNKLLRYCSTHFDKHIQNVQELTNNILDTLDYFLSIDTQALATILQIRSVNMDHYFIKLETHLWQVDAMTMIYSTALYELLHLHKSKWMKQKASQSLLHLAATGGLLDPIERLMKSGISVDVKDENGVRALYYSSENGHYDICQLFLWNSVDINAEGGLYGCALSKRYHSKVMRI